MPPAWLTALSWTALAVGFAAAADILIDIYPRRHRQPMPIIEAVWPVTALYSGPATSWAYRRFGRPASRRWQVDYDLDQPPRKPAWAGTAIGVSHCGAGCTLGDILAEFVVFGLGATVACVTVYAAMIGDYLAALALGIVFQYFAIAPIRDLNLREGLIQAAKADVLSLTAFEIGLFEAM